MHNDSSSRQSLNLEFQCLGQGLMPNTLQVYGAGQLHVVASNFFHFRLSTSYKPPCTSYVLLAMSSLRNSLHRPSHKERSQLSHRAKLGILEKHSDYVLRARDYHSKRDRIKRLKQKVAERNKDEFYFGMVRQKTQVRFEGNMEFKLC